MYLDECLNSLKDLNPEEYEIIAVNDGSTDKSPEILQKWSSELKNLKIINQNNRGLSAARNVGIEKAKGDYIAFIDSDDYVDPYKLKEIFLTATKFNTDICIGDYTEISDNNTQTNKYFLNENTNEIKTGKEFFCKNYKKIRSVVWRSIYKRIFLQQNKLQFHEGIFYEDIEFTPRAFINAKYVVYSNINFYCYRKRSGSITTTTVTKKKIYDSLRVWQSLDKEYSILHDGYSLDRKLSRIIASIGFHCFLMRYLYYQEPLDNYVQREAIQLSHQKMIGLKYEIISWLFRQLPNYLFLKILRFIYLKK